MKYTSPPPIQTQHIDRNQCAVNAQREQMQRLAAERRQESKPNKNNNR